jgi:hypothetical protein
MLEIHIREEHQARAREGSQAFQLINRHSCWGGVWVPAALLLTNEDPEVIGPGAAHDSRAQGASRVDGAAVDGQQHLHVLSRLACSGFGCMYSCWRGGVTQAGWPQAPMGGQRQKLNNVALGAWQPTSEAKGTAAPYES